MMEVLRFIFSNFWIWLGTVILLGVLTSPLYGLIQVVIKRKEPK